MKEYYPWLILFTHILILLGLDLFVLHKKNQQTTVKRAISETVFFVLNALLFSLLIYGIYGNNLIENSDNLLPKQAFIKYLTGYIVELSLSIDNLFVIAVIFKSYKIPVHNQHRLLFLGILGAIILRAILIALGLTLIHIVHNISILFGLFLMYTAFRMLKDENQEEIVDKTKGLVKLFLIGNTQDGTKFTTRINGKLVFTTFFGALLAIEFADFVFAFDSILAIFAVTTDAFLVFSSNIFAIMGLRSLYFFLARMLEKFHYLKYSLFAILVFVSLKLMTASLLEIPEWFSLLFIGISFAFGIRISITHVSKH